MAKAASAAMKFEDNFTKKEMEGLFGKPTASKRTIKAVPAPKVRKYLVSVENAGAGLLLQRQALLLARFVKRHVAPISFLLFGLGCFIMGLSIGR